MKLKPHIVIVGGGAGGLELAVRLGDTLGKKEQARISLVDKHLTHIWKPLLHEVAAGTLDSHEDELNYLMLANQHSFNFEFGNLVHLNRDNKSITLKPITVLGQANTLTAREIRYDILVLALGSIANDFNTEGAREHCYFLDEIEQAENLHQEFLNYYIRSRYQGYLKLQIAIIGGGATGIELAAELHFASQNLKRYGFEVKKEQVEITIIESAPRLLGNLSPHFSQQIKSELEKKNINILLSEKVSKVTHDGVYTQNGHYIPAQLKIWSAGIKCDSLLSQLDGLEVNKLNQLVVKQTLQTTQDEYIFAFGDCAACPQKNSDRPVPPRAQSAHQEAEFLAKSLKLMIKGKRLPYFYYKDYGSLVTISQYTAIGRLMAHRNIHIGIGGKLARWVYAALYKRHQIIILGWWRVLMLSIANFFTRHTKTRLKLH